MLGAGNYFKVKIVAFAPALFDQDAAQPLHVIRAAATFFGTHVEPNARTALQIYASYEIQDPAAVPPYGRRKYGELAENLRKAQAKINRKQAAERRATDSGIGRSIERTILRFDEWLDFFEQHPAVPVGFAAAHFFVARRRVLAKTPSTSVVNANDYQRANSSLSNRLVGGVFYVPIHAGNERGCGVEKILAVLQIEHRIARLRIFVVAWRKIND